MEASARIVDAMRRSVAARGAAGSTFDQVAREAGVSRGLLHYHFGTKEKLLAEVVRRDAEIRLEHLGSELAGAGTVAEVIAALVHSLEDLVERDPGFVALMFELFTSGRRNPEIAAEFAALQRATRDARGQSCWPPASARASIAVGRRAGGGRGRAARRSPTAWRCACWASRTTITAQHWTPRPRPRGR